MKVGCWEYWGQLDKDGYGVTRPHRAMWRRIYGSIPPKMFVCHHCDNPACFRPSHLFLGTPADNMHDRDRKNRSAYGERSPHAKLTPAKVKAIRESPLQQRQLAKKYGVCQATIKEAIHRETWARVP